MWITFTAKRKNKFGLCYGIAYICVIKVINQIKNLIKMTTQTTARPNTTIGGTFIDVSITPIGDGKRQSSFSKEVYVMTDICDLPKNKRRTSTLRHIINTVEGCLPLYDHEATFSINGLDFYFKKENGRVSINYIRMTTRATYITPIFWAI